MSSDIAIRVNSLSKCYEIYETPRDRLKQFFYPKIKQMLGRAERKYYREFWALNDISFEVKRGETVGIVGCNGSGKSTLLQSICGTLTQTTGTVETFGRVAALLELGSGFNPDFTGRENVYMNASLLGLAQDEIVSRFNRIVDFAEIGDFIDQPVKTYSSGMFVRLAFAIVINVDPEVLIIDEALSVGDAKFQLKCFRKLEEIRAAGTTILFVTHDTTTVKSFCSRAILLNKGVMLEDGEPREVVMRYFDILFPKDDKNLVSECFEVEPIIDRVSDPNSDKDVISEPSSVKRLISEPNSVKRLISEPNSVKELISEPNSVKELIIKPKSSDLSFGMGSAVVKKIKIIGMDSSRTVCGGEKLEIFVKYKWDVSEAQRLAKENGVKPELIMGVSVSDNKGTYLFGCTTYDKDVLVDLESDKDEVVFTYDMPHLTEGKYFIHAALALGTQESHVQLCWYDGLVELNIISVKKYIYGLFYNDYSVSMRGV